MNLKLEARFGKVLLKYVSMRCSIFIHYHFFDCRILYDIVDELTFEVKRGHFETRIRVQDYEIEFQIFGIEHACDELRERTSPTCKKDGNRL